MINNLKRVVVKQRQFSNIGSTVLKVMQNTTSNIVDLYVRESLQNSLDAGLLKKDVVVDYSVLEFKSSNIINMLDGLNKDFILKKFPNEIEKQLVITDKNTTGLTGSLDINDSHNSNFYKLIYSLGQEQLESGSGGSWGYGKTIYYRMGIGLVLYYTRFKDGDSFKERLVFCLIENEQNNNKYATYEKNYNTGISWWGNKDTKDGDEYSLPITDSDDIKNILEMMNLKRYENDETGTLISIPYIHEESLTPNNFNGDTYKYDDLSEYIEMSVQRWYSPRLNNHLYNIGKKNSLIVSINNEEITENNMEPFFKLTQCMYNYASNNITLEEVKENFPNIEIEQKDINVSAQNLHGFKGTKIGSLSYAKVHYRDLGMGHAKYLNNPYNLIGARRETYEDENNAPIIMMTRQPGMIIKYDLDGKWSNGIPRSASEEFILGFFVLNSQKDTYFETNEGIKILEEYIRGSEKADHMDWNDASITTKELRTYTPNIIHRITSNITRTIRETFFKTNKNTEKTSITNHLQSLLGSTIMPPTGFGAAGTRRPRKSSNSESRKTKHISSIIEYNKAYFSKNQIDIPFKINILNSDFNKIKITVMIRTEAGSLRLKNYEIMTRKNSPISINKVKVKTNNQNNAINDYLIVNKDDFIMLNKIEKQKLFKEGDYIEGLIEINHEDKNYTPIIRIEVEE